MPGWRVLIGMVVTLVLGQAATAQEFLSGAKLYNDVARYASFGSHRFGSPGDRATTDWIAGELQAAGLSVEFQPVILGRQYFVDRAIAEVDGTTVDATPFWWPPEDKSSFRLTAPVMREGEVAGKILWIELPYDRGAYLGPAHRAAIAQAAARGPTAILLVIGNPGDDRFAYNVTQEDAPWPLPVMVVAGKTRAVFERAMTSGAPVTLDVAGRYERNVAGRNVVARFGAGTGPAIVVSTPMTGWYDCVCERGPGIANFLALARIVAAEKLPGNFVFVATAGHEIGHGGMELFLKQGAPPPQNTLVWLHLGASNACYAWTEGRKVLPGKTASTTRCASWCSVRPPCRWSAKPSPRSRRRVWSRRSRRSANCATCMRRATAISSAWPGCIASSIRRPTISAPRVRRFSNRWPAPSPTPCERPSSAGSARSSRPDPASGKARRRFAPEAKADRSEPLLPVLINSARGSNIRDNAGSTP